MCIRDSHDIEPHLIEDRGGAREAVQTMRRIGEHGGAAAVRQLPYGNQGGVIAGVAARQYAGLPGDLFRRVAQEVRLGPLGPHLRYLLLRDRRHFRPRVLLSFADQFILIDRGFQPAAQRALGALVELLEQAGFPGIPQFRIGAADVGGGQYVQIVQMSLIADVRGTNPKLWNAWKSRLFEEFYERTK